MPGIDGLEVHSRLRADPQTQLVPIVMLPSSTIDKEFARGQRLGVNSSVRKPTDFRPFADVVRERGRYWRPLNERPLATGSL